MTTNAFELRHFLRTLVFDPNPSLGVKSLLKECLKCILEGNYTVEERVIFNTNLARFNEKIEVIYTSAKFTDKYIPLIDLKDQLSEYLPEIDNVILHMGNKLDKRINTFIERMCKFHGFTYLDTSE
jgi:isoleucyl-tRNA synthetase